MRIFVAMLMAGLCAPAALAQSAAAPLPGPPPGCTGPEHRQFDFWVGRWDVYRTGTETRVGASLIESLSRGCLIRETWMPANAPGGSSLNHYDRGERRWHQSWYDGANAHVEFAGGLAGGKMVLTGFWPHASGPNTHGLIRMSYSREAAGAVRQYGEISTDHGLSWRPFFDLTYRPSKGSS